MIQSVGSNPAISANLTMPKKRIIRKLNDRVKERIKKDYAKLSKKDFDGEALVYLNRVKGAAKGRKAKKAKVAKVDDLLVPRDSEMYRIIEAAAKAKKMSVAAFMKKHRESIEALMKDGDVVLQRETDYLIEDIRRLKKGKKVFVNDGNGYVKKSPLNDIYDIQAFTQKIATTDIFLIIYRVHYKLNGDLTHYLPDPEEYDELEEVEEIMEMLDSYYPDITYLRSAKKDDQPKAQKRISTADKKRAQKNKHKPNNRSKR